jgi:hypothetical protein
MITHDLVAVHVTNVCAASRDLALQRGRDDEKRIGWEQRSRVQRSVGLRRARPALLEGIGRGRRQMSERTIIDREVGE